MSWENGRRLTKVLLARSAMSTNKAPPKLRPIPTASNHNFEYSLQGALQAGAAAARPEMLVAEATWYFFYILPKT